MKGNESKEGIFLFRIFGKKVVWGGDLLVYYI